MADRQFSPDLKLPACSDRVSVTHNIPDFRKDMERSKEDLHEQVIAPGARHMFKTIAKIATGKYMRSSRSGLGRDTGRLARSLTTSRQGIERLTVRGGKVLAEKGTRVEYASTHELGFDRKVRVRAYKRQGHAVRPHIRHMVIPAQPFLGPAFDDAEPSIIKRFTQLFKGWIG